MVDISTSHYISPVYHENLQSTFDHIYQLIEVGSFKEAKEILLVLHYADLATVLENTNYDVQAQPMFSL